MRHYGGLGLIAMVAGCLDSPRQFAEQDVAAGATTADVRGAIMPDAAGGVERVRPPTQQGARLTDEDSEQDGGGSETAIGSEAEAEPLDHGDAAGAGGASTQGASPDPQPSAGQRVCASGFRRCGDGCVPQQSCCDDSECPGGGVCVDGDCQAPPCDEGQSKCNDTCIPDEACCSDEDCVDNFACVAGACSVSQCATGFKRCISDCIPESGCCFAGTCAGGRACIGHVCSDTECSAGYRRCGDECIEETQCCVDDECGGGLGCVDSVCTNSRCADGFRACGEGCISQANCCVDADCGGNFACVAGSCSTRHCQPTVCDPVCDMTTPCRPNYAFVSDVTYDFSAINSAQAADAACQTLANSAGVPGNFHAFLTEAEEDFGGHCASCQERLDGAAGWVRVDGLPFANSTDSEYVYHPLKVTSTRAVLDPAAPDEILTGGCSTLSSSVGTGMNSGNATYGGVSWSYGSRIACDSPFRLMCFGVDYVASLAPQPQDGRIAFHAEVYLVGGGLAAADSHCQAAAADAGLSGNFLAMLPTSTSSAASRFDLGPGSLPYVRVDGTRVTENAADLFTAGGQILAAMNQDARGEPTFTTMIRVGATGPRDAPDPQMPATLETTCNDWTSADPELGSWAGRAQSTRIKGLFGSAFNRPCDAISSILCLEQ